MIAVDQFEIAKPGRLFESRGRESVTRKYCGGTIFYDPATKVMKCYFQHSLNGEETVLSKNKFERFMLDNGAEVKHYRSDNGIFTKQRFMEEILNNDQVISCCGVGAHHQNAHAERAIRTVITSSRTMILHAILRWPDETKTDFWPMAVQHASYIHNIVPRMDCGISPIEMLTKSFSKNNLLNTLPVWGCPTYVLHPTLQSKGKLPKWQPRSRRAQFMGWSSLHASNVALVRHLTTNHISPQFHVIFDNWFETIMVEDSLSEVPEWDVMFTQNQHEIPLDPIDVEGFELHDDFLTKEEIIEKRLGSQETSDKTSGQHSDSKQSSQINDVPTTATPPQDEQGGDDQVQHQTLKVQRKSFKETVKFQRKPPKETLKLQRKPPFPMNSKLQECSQRKHGPSIPPAPNITESSINSSRPTRSRKAPKRYGYDGNGPEAYFNYTDLVSDMMQTNHSLTPEAYMNMINTDIETGVVDRFESGPSFKAFKATSTVDPDSPNFKQAMQGPHREEFLKAMHNEVKQLQALNTWTTTAYLRKKLPKDTQVIPLTWIFKIKRRPNGDFYRFKARLCYRGDLDLNPLPSYSPVVRWTTIRSVLAFALNNDLVTKQIDFSNAFVQASLPSDMNKYTEVPNAQGFAKKCNLPWCLKLIKSLCGMVEAPSLWFEALSKAL